MQECSVSLVASDVAATMLLLVTDPAEPLAADDLQRLFDLTVAEAGVALAVPEHDRLRDIVDRLGRSLATVRTQLVAALTRTDTKRQAELVRLLMAHGRRP